jgi:hypothetical protein
MMRSGCQKIKRAADKKRKNFSITFFSYRRVVRAPKAESAVPYNIGTSWNQQLDPHPVMSVDRRKIAVFGAAFMLRLLLTCLFPSLPDLLTGRVEVSTPVNSFKRRTCLRLLTPHSVN